MRSIYLRGKNFPKTCTMTSIKRKLILGNLTPGEYWVCSLR
jgi:hypothetical protein